MVHGILVFDADTLEPIQTNWLFFLAAILLVLLYGAGWVMTLLGLPGAWLMVVAAALYAWLMPAESRLAIGWPTVFVLVALALLGELIESAASAMGARRAGGSRRGMALSVVGSIAGAILGAGVGIPIPVMGSVIGAVLGAAIGAFIGSVVGETWKGHDLEMSWRVGEAAFWGRLVGTLAKLGVATAMVIVGVMALAI
jgi:uncharacterized protein YqgC (DUF456 family)